jgi:hypothetical protein
MQRQPATTGLQIRVNRGTAWPADRAHAQRGHLTLRLHPVSRPGGSQIDGSAAPRKYTFLYKCTSRFSSVLSACARGGAAAAAAARAARARARTRAAAPRGRGRGDIY